MVLDSATSPESLVLHVETQSRGAPVVVAIHLDRSGQRNIIHDVASIHPRRPAAQIVGWMQSGLLRYINDRSAGTWSRSTGLRLPKEGIKNRRGHKILRHRDVFKRSDGPALRIPVGGRAAFRA